MAEYPVGVNKVLVTKNGQVYIDGLKIDRVSEITVSISATADPIVTMSFQTAEVEIDGYRNGMAELIRASQSKTSESP